MTKHYYSIDKDLRLKQSDAVPKSQNNDSTDMNMLAKYSSVGYYLVTPLLVGVFCGLFVDKSFHTNPYGIIGGVVLGTVATFYNLIRLTKE